MQPLIIISVLFSANIALFLLLKKFNHSSYKKIRSDVFKGGGALLIALFFFCGYMYFLKEHSLVFKCQKETMTCAYSRSTEFNKTLRLVKIYDISSIKKADWYRFRRGKSPRFGVTLDMKKGSSIELPFDFSHKYEAQNEAELFNNFLFSSQKNYAYVKYLSDISSANNTGIVITVLTLLYFLLFILKGFWQHPADTEEKYENDEADYDDKHPPLSSEAQNNDDTIHRTKDI